MLTITAMVTMAIESSQRDYQNLARKDPNEVVMAEPDSTVFVSSGAECPLSATVVLKGFANLVLVRIEVERPSR